MWLACSALLVSCLVSPWAAGSEPVSSGEQVTAAAVRTNDRPGSGRANAVRGIAPRAMGHQTAQRNPPRTQRAVSGSHAFSANPAASSPASGNAWRRSGVTQLARRPGPAAAALPRRMTATTLAVNVKRPVTGNGVLGGPHASAGGMIGGPAGNRNGIKAGIDGTAFRHRK
jgi:hypothetical protein